jgi:hypothetical protein
MRHGGHGVFRIVTEGTLIGDDLVIDYILPNTVATGDDINVGIIIQIGGSDTLDAIGMRRRLIIPPPVIGERNNLRE